MADVYLMCKEKINNKDEMAERYLKVITASLGATVKKDFIALYFKNVEAFLSEYKESQQFQVCSYVYERIFSKKKISNEDAVIFSLLTDTMFKGKTFKSLSKYVKDIRQISIILQDSYTLNILLNERVPLYLEGEFLSKSIQGGKLPKDFIDSLEKNYIFYKYTFSQDVGNDFVNTYLSNIVTIFIRYYEKDFVSYLERYVAPLSVYSDFKDAMVEIIEPISEETYKMVVKLFNFILKSKSSFGELIKDIINKYLKKIGGKRKKLFASLIEGVDNKHSMEQFVKDYEKQNEPMLSKIFGKLFGKKDGD